VRGYAMYVDGKILSVTKYRIPFFFMEQAHELYKGARIRSLIAM